MTTASTWQDPIGLDTIKKVTARCIPEWPNGLYDYQLDPISKILNRESVFFVSGTGRGKAALFMVPLVVHRELTIRLQAQSYPHLPVQVRPVAIVITPTKKLASSIISEAESLGLNGLSYCHDVISEYRMKKHDLTHLICECKTWDLLCVNPEHLNSAEWRTIIQDVRVAVESLGSGVQAGSLGARSEFLSFESSDIGLWRGKLNVKRRGDGSSTRG
ncbi:hypothetical protein PQX77_013633, partial [Marasmius sp. AFHP31]